MAYLGRQPIVGNYQVLDALTATTTDTYALTKNSVAVYPQTPANCIVSLNGVIQAPFDSYTISGSNIVFASALTASDSIDFITVLGDVLNVGTVSDGTIGLAKLSATGTKDATTFLRGDNTFASPSGGTNTPAFEAYLSATQTITATTDVKIQINTERFDTANAYDNSSNYRFTPQTAGKYFVYANLNLQTVGNKIYVGIAKLFKNGSVYSQSTYVFANNITNTAPIFTSANIDMNGSTDYVEVYSYIEPHDGATTRITPEFAGTYFGAYKIIE